VLFACSHNAIRSPMAEALAKRLYGHSTYLDSVGVNPDQLDNFAVAVLDEIGIDLHAHHGKSFDDIDPSSFDLIVTLSPEAHHKALELAGAFAIDVEYWPTPDPTMASGNREQILNAYRGVRDGLFRRIKQRFPIVGAPNV